MKRGFLRAAGLVIASAGKYRTHNDVIRLARRAGRGQAGGRPRAGRLGDVVVAELDSRCGGRRQR